MDKEIKAIILAAGKGTRMKSTKPKVLHEIFSKPLVGWVVESVNSLQYKADSITVIGCGAELVEDYLKNNYDNVQTVLQKEQLGTAHAVSMALPLLEDFKGCVIITCGDTPLLKTSTLDEFIKFHMSQNADLTVMTTKYDNPFGYGRIIRNQNDEIEAIVEQKDATESQKLINEVNTGVYCLNWEKIKPAFLDLKNNNSQGEYYLTDIVKWANDKSYKVSGYVAKNSYELYGINSRANLATALQLMKDNYNEELMAKGVTIVDPLTTYISPETTIEEDTIIYPNTYIEGKNTIAKFCKIGPMARLRGGCSIGEGCKIGNFVELKNAQLAKKTNVCHLSYVGDAELGSNINIGAGTIFANYNSITKEKKKSILFDGVSIGSNSVIVAPVEIKENAFVAASTTVTKDVEDSSLVITRGPQKEIKNWVKNYKK